MTKVSKKWRIIIVIILLLTLIPNSVYADDLPTNEDVAEAEGAETEGDEDKAVITPESPDEEFSDAAEQQESDFDGVTEPEPDAASMETETSIQESSSALASAIPEPRLMLYEQNGKWFIKDENTGKNLKGTWVTIGDKKYYASDNESLHRNRTINMAGKNYYVGDDCSVVMGKVVYDKNRDKYYYTDPNTGVYVKGQWVNYNGKKYYASDSEVLHRNRTINMAGKNYYVGDDCSVVMGKVVYDKNRDKYYYTDPNTGVYVKGQWVNYNGKKYYASDSEVLHRNRTINMAGKNYYVGDDCSVVMGKIVYDKNRDKYYYTDPNTGVYVKGQWVNYNGKKYYASDSEPLHRNRTINMAGKNYYVGNDCSVQYGIVKDSRTGYYYYADPSSGVLKSNSGWIEVNGKKYYAKSDGRLYCNEGLKVDGKLYVAGSDCTVKVANKVVYLTFDDGPGPYTPKLLRVLEKYNVRATFFVNGNNSKYRYCIGQAYKQGHAIGNHTYSHNYSYCYSSESNFWADFDKAQNIIKAQTGTTTKLLRFPGGSSNTVSRGYSRGIMSRLAKQTHQKGYEYFDWNVDSGDAGGVRTASGVYQNIINGISKRKVSVVLCHDIKSYTVDAMEDVIKWGLNHGYVFLPMDINSPTAHHAINN